MQKEHYSAVFDECILKKPKRIHRPDKIFSTITYDTPVEVAERKHTSLTFEPAGVIPGSGKFYEIYTPDDDPLLRSDVVIARDPDFPLQMIVGPQKYFIDQMMLSLFYLKNFFGINHPFHHMDLVASNTYSSEKPYDVKKDGYLWTHNLLEKLNIEKMRLKYSKYGSWNQEKPHVGIRRDIPWPVFFMEYKETKGPSEENEMAIKQASNMVHDFTHYLLFLYGYRATGSMAERICLTNQLTFLESVICRNSGLFDNDTFNNWSVGADRDATGYIVRLIDYIKDYQSGGNKALDEAKKAFGYNIPKDIDDARYPKFKDFR